MMMYGLIALLIVIVVVIIAVLALVLLTTRGNMYRKDRQLDDLKEQPSSPLAPPMVYPEPASTATVMSCPNCGAALQSEFTHCPQCGAPIDKPMGD